MNDEVSTHFYLICSAMSVDSRVKHKLLPNSLT